MDENYNPDIVSVVDEDGVEHTFEELGRIETDDARYVALLPVYDEAEEILEDDGELIILKVSEEDGETYLEPIRMRKNSTKSAVSLKNAFRKCLTLTNRTNKGFRKEKYTY